MQFQRTRSTYIRSECQRESVREVDVRINASLRRRIVLRGLLQHELTLKQKLNADFTQYVILGAIAAEVRQRPEAVLAGI